MGWTLLSAAATTLRRAANYSSVKPKHTHTHTAEPHVPSGYSLPDQLLGILRTEEGQRSVWTHTENTPAAPCWLAAVLLLSSTISQSINQLLFLQKSEESPHLDEGHHVRVVHVAGHGLQQLPVGLHAVFVAAHQCLDAADLLLLVGSDLPCHRL